MDLPGPTNKGKSRDGYRGECAKPRPLPPPDVQTKRREEAFTRQAAVLEVEVRVASGQVVKFSLRENDGAMPSSWPLAAAFPAVRPSGRSHLTATRNA